MADTNNSNSMKQSSMNQNPDKQGQTLQHEQAKASVSGQSGQNTGSQSMGGQSGFDQGQEKSAIGGGENRSQTGEPGRARNELDQGRETGRESEFDKNKQSELSNQR